MFSFYIFDVSNSYLYIMKKNIWFYVIHKNTHIIYITLVLTQVTSFITTYFNGQNKLRD